MFESCFQIRIREKCVLLIVISDFGSISFVNYELNSTFFQLLSLLSYGFEVIANPISDISLAFNSPLQGRRAACRDRARPVQFHAFEYEVPARKLEHP